MHLLHVVAFGNTEGFLAPNYQASISYTVGEDCWCVPSFSATDLALNNMFGIAYPEITLKASREAKMLRAMV